MVLDEIKAEMAAKGFDCAELQPDGKFYRFGRNGSKDSAWAVCWSNARISDGSFYTVGMFGDFRSDERHTYKPDRLSREDKGAVDNQLKAKADEMRKEREQNQIAVSIETERRFKSAAKNGMTTYMHRKGIHDLYGAGIYDDRLQIPMRDVKGNIWSMQTIYPDGKKIFSKGGRKKGLFHVIGKPLTEDCLAFLVEGFATGVSVHLATDKSVVVCFDAGNLVEVSQELKVAFPHAGFTVCGDDDRNNPENPGRAKGEKAAMILNCPAIFPVFGEGEDSASDFNDLHALRGLAEVQRQIVGEPHERTTGFIPLGFEDANYFFYHIPSKDIVRLTTFSPIQMSSLAPLEHWQASYPTKKGGADLGRAADELIQLCKKIGHFDPTRVRGTGVWLDEKRTVINLGRSMLLDNREVSLSTLSSWYIYVQTRNRIPSLHEQPLGKEDGRRLAQACAMFKWKNSTDYMQLAGWLFIARIAGALPIRPHIWITGGKGTGKSTLMERLVAPLLGSPKGKLHLIGATTEAGIRQAARCSSMPLIFDEFESTTKSSQDRIEAILELLRNSWSQSQGKVLKGGATGSGTEYALNFAALLSSIRVRLENDADRSRFSVLELLEHGSVAGQWQVMSAELSVLTADVGERLFARAVKMVPIVMACQEVIAGFLSLKVSQRYGQQVGTLLAGYWCLLNDHICSPLEAAELVEGFFSNTQDDDNIKEEMNDEQECLNTLLTTKISLRIEGEMGKTVDRSIGEIIGDKHCTDRELLVKYGIKISHDGQKYYVANKHSEMAKIYQGTRWANNWSRSLKRLPGAKSVAQMSFGSRQIKSHAVELPLI